jgi:hypothetical protein
LIIRLKREARKLYKKIHANPALEYGCGIKLARYINPELSCDIRAFDDIMDKLRELDPRCPPSEEEQA